MLYGQWLSELTINGKKNEKTAYANSAVTIFISFYAPVDGFCNLKTFPLISMLEKRKNTTIVSVMKIKKNWNE